MQPKIIFFDIDGTLVDFDEDTVHPAVLEALAALQAKGTKLFLATGRPPYLVPKIDGFTFDGALCFNGAYSFDQNGVLVSEPIPKADVRRMAQNGEQIGVPALLAGAHTMGSNFYQKNLEDYMAFASHPDHVVDRDTFEKLLESDIYQVMAGTTAAQDPAYLAGTKGAQVMRWWDRACDIVPKGMDKGKGIERVLTAYGIDRSESAAFGDGGNDLAMLRAVGLGVAMGNADPEVKAVADAVAPSVSEDGVAAAVKAFGWI